MFWDGDAKAAIIATCRHTRGEKMKKIIFALLINLFFVGLAGAQTTEFTYQGRLLDNSLPPTANYDFEFSLWDSLVAGSQQGTTQTVTGVAVSNGIFSVRLDFGMQFPGAPRFLQIAVRPSGPGGYTTLAPRQPFTSSPYAIRSINAGTADALSSACASCITDAQVANNLTITGGTINNTAIGGTTPASATFTTANANIFNATEQYNLGGARILATGTPGLANLFAGHLAGPATTGHNNSFFGWSAGRFNTTGNNNAFFGSFAGSVNVDGNFNAFFGSGAGGSNTSGFSNTFIGSGGAGTANQGGQSNTFIGASSGIASLANFNTFVGAFSGQANTTGGNNTILGAGANLGAVDLGFATAIGSGSTVETSNTIALGRSTGEDAVRIYGNSVTVGGNTAFTLGRGTNPAGVGQPFTIAGQNGGGTNSAGGYVAIVGGVSTGTANGGDLFLDGGIAPGTGLSGRINLGSFGSTREVNIGNANSPINTARTITGSAANVRTETSDTTPDVTNLTTLILDYPSATTITDLTGEVAGQCVHLIAKSLVTINDGGVFRLSGDRNWSSNSDDDTLTLCQANSGWTETSRNTDVATEIAPGVASALGTTQGGLTTGVTHTILQRTITVPTAGYVIAIGSTSAIVHQDPSGGAAYFGVSDSGSTFQTSSRITVGIPGSGGSDTFDIPVTSQGLFQVSAGSRTFWFLGQELFGDVFYNPPQLTLLFVPTSYGVVTPTIPEPIAEKSVRLTKPEPDQKPTDPVVQQTNLRASTPKENGNKIVPAAATTGDQPAINGLIKLIKDQKLQLDALKRFICGKDPTADLCKEEK